MAGIQVQDGVEESGKQDEDDDQRDGYEEGEVGDGLGQTTLDGRSPVPGAIQVIVVGVTFFAISIHVS